MCTKNGLQSSGATERGVVVFSRVIFGAPDLDSGGANQRGGDHPTGTFFLHSPIPLRPLVFAARPFDRKKNVVGPVWPTWGITKKIGELRVEWTKQNLYTYFFSFLRAAVWELLYDASCVK